MLQTQLKIMVLQVLQDLPARREIKEIPVPPDHAVLLVWTGQMGNPAQFVVHPVSLFQAKKVSLDLQALQALRVSRDLQDCLLVFRVLRAKWALLERVERMDLVVKLDRKEVEAFPG